MKIKLVVGLGNPGKEYKYTRHNMGFMVLDEIAKRLEIYKWKQRDGALYFDTHLDMSRVIFIKPQNYINLSGDVMIKFVKYLTLTLLFKLNAGLSVNLYKEIISTLYISLNILA